jgi:hypothetical protein
VNDFDKKNGKNCRWWDSPELEICLIDILERVHRNALVSVKSTSQTRFGGGSLFFLLGKWKTEMRRGARCRISQYSINFEDMQ